MYECESWTIKEAECWRTDAFELWCWRRLLRVPWTARRSSQSILKEISPEYSLEVRILIGAEAPMIWPPDVKNWLTGKTQVLRKTEGKRKKGRQRIRWLHGITVSMDMSLSKLREKVKHREAWHVSVYGVTKSQTQLSYWTTTTTCTLSGSQEKKEMGRKCNWCNNGWKYPFTEV